MLELLLLQHVQTNVFTHRLGLDLGCRMCIITFRVAAASSLPLFAFGIRLRNNEPLKVD